MNRLIALMLSFVAFHAICMDQPSYPQRQLELPSNKKVEHVTGVLRPDNLLNSAFIVPKEYNDKYIDKSSLKAVYGEPFVMMQIKKQNDPTLYNVILPARSQWGLNDGSTVKFTFPAHEENIDEYSYELKCVKHPHLEGDFQQQFSAHMNKFYQTPNISYIPEKDGNEFVENGLLANLRSTALVFRSNGSYEKVLTAEHGPKGISSEKKFIQMMQEEKTAPFKKSAFQFVMQRQMGNTRQTTSPKRPQPTQVMNAIEPEDFQPTHGRPEGEYGRHDNACILL